jgi:hypothetical protein
MTEHTRARYVLHTFAKPLHIRTDQELLLHFDSLCFEATRIGSREQIGWHILFIVTDPKQEIDQAIRVILVFLGEQNKRAKSVLITDRIGNLSLIKNKLILLDASEIKNY